MDVFQRLQPLDVVFALVWAAIIGWGLLTGLIRQLGMLIGVYGATILAGSLYRPFGQDLAMGFGRENLPMLEFVAYALLLVVTFGVIGVTIGRAYPVSRISRGFGTDNVLGAAVAAIWGVLLLIALLTILRFYAAVAWREQAAGQRVVLGVIQRSQVAPVLEVVAAPLWQTMAPWFPASVTSTYKKV